MMNKLLQSKRRGSVLPLTVVAILILLAMGVGLLSLGFNSRVYSVRTASDIAARCAADAGLAMALFEMNQKLLVKPYKEGTLPEAIDASLPYSSQVCSYRVTGDLGGGYVITSVGESGQAQRAVRATIGLQSAFDHAILTKQSLTLKSGTTVDGYNSLDPFDKDVKVDIGSQSGADSSIILNNGTTVNGDVFVAGNLDSAIKDLGATVTGDKIVSAPEPLPRVTAPALPGKGEISAKGATVTITPADSGSYTGIALKADKNPGILVVEGGNVVLHVTGNIGLGNTCEIIIKDNASLTIYADANIQCDNGSGINMLNPPTEAVTFQLYATGQGAQTFDIKAKSQFTGIIYAPDADVDLYANGDAYGSVIARDFEYKAGGNFHYDEALQNKNTVNDEAVQFVVTRWHESAPTLATLDFDAVVAEPLPVELVK
jgi:hypothetical protein